MTEETGVIQDSDKYEINKHGKFVLKPEYQPKQPRKQPELQYIKRYLESKPGFTFPIEQTNTTLEDSGIYIEEPVKPKPKKDRSPTLQDYGWLKDGERILVRFCEKCQAQHSFDVVSEEKGISQRIDPETGLPYTYVKGYWGYCLGCYDKSLGITPSGGNL